jgi:hypothetical protein
MNKKSKQALEEFVRWAREWIEVHPEFDLWKSGLYKSLNVERSVDTNQCEADSKLSREAEVLSTSPRVG